MAKNLLQNSCDLVPVTPALATSGVLTPMGLVKIATKTMAAANAISFNNLGQYPYTNFLVRYNIYSVSSAVILVSRISIDNGATFIASSYLGQAISVPEGSSTWTPGSSGSNFVLTASMNTQASGTINYLNMNTSSPTNFVAVNGSSTVIVAGNPNLSLCHGLYSVLANANAFEMFLNGGVTTGNGIFDLYGYS